MFVADCAKTLQFAQCVERTILRRLRDVEHPWCNHMLVGLIGIELLYIFCNILGSYLAIGVG